MVYIPVWYASAGELSDSTSTLTGQPSEKEDHAPKRQSL